MQVKQPLPQRQALGGLVALVIALAACTGGPPATSTPSPAPTPSPITVTVNTPDDAAALVIATDLRFQGVTKLNPGMIGASRWWVSDPRNGGGFVITITIGWGDCPAGCISRHVWTYEVAGDGQVSLTGETGDPMPEGQLQP